MSPTQLSLRVGFGGFLPLGSEERAWLQVKVGGGVQAEVFLKRQRNPENEPLAHGSVRSPSLKVQKHSGDLNAEATAPSRVASSKCDMSSLSLSSPTCQWETLTARGEGKMPPK